MYQHSRTTFDSSNGSVPSNAGKLRTSATIAMFRAPFMGLPIIFDARHLLPSTVLDPAWASSTHRSLVPNHSAVKIGPHRTSADEAQPVRPRKRAGGMDGGLRGVQVMKQTVRTGRKWSDVLSSFVLLPVDLFGVSQIG